MPELDDYSDDQEQSEVFDETHIDEEGDGDILPDEADPVLDVTQADGDADEDEFDEDEEERRAESRQEALVDEGVEETFPASDPVSVKRIT